MTGIIEIGLQFDASGGFQAFKTGCTSQCFQEISISDRVIQVLIISRSTLPITGKATLKTLIQIPFEPEAAVLNMLVRVCCSMIKVTGTE